MVYFSIMFNLAVLALACSMDVNPVCVQYHSPSSYEAVFEWTNDGHSSETIHISKHGNKNYFKPGSQNVGQPTIFEPGSGIFITPSRSSHKVKWYLGHKSASLYSCEGRHTCVRCCGGHGTMGPTGICLCDSGYQGQECDAFCGLACSHGTLDPVACSCSCDSGYSGEDCSCGLTCLHGTLDPESCSCSCDSGYSGEDCSCGLTCSHGTLDPVSCSCSCDSGYSGEDCSCGLTCSHGTLDPVSCSCECDSGWSGVSCSIISSVHTSGYVMSHISPDDGVVCITLKSKISPSAGGLVMMGMPTPMPIGGHTFHPVVAGALNITDQAVLMNTSSYICQDDTGGECDQYWVFCGDLVEEDYDSVANAQFNMHASLLSGGVVGGALHTEYYMPFMSRPIDARNLTLVLETFVDHEFSVPLTPPVAQHAGKPIFATLTVTELQHIVGVRAEISQVLSQCNSSGMGECTTYAEKSAPYDELASGEVAIVPCPMTVGDAEICIAFLPIVDMDTFAVHRRADIHLLCEVNIVFTPLLLGSAGGVGAGHGILSRHEMSVSTMSGVWCPRDVCYTGGLNSPVCCDDAVSGYVDGFTNSAATIAVTPLLSLLAIMAILTIIDLDHNPR